MLNCHHWMRNPAILRVVVLGAALGLAAAMARPLGAEVLRRQVLSPDGTPAAGAVVTVRTFVRDNGYPLTHELRTLTNEHGFFAVQTDLYDSWAQGSYLLVDAPGCAVVVARVRPNPAPLRLQAAYTVHGRVRDELGRPIGGARVYLGELSERLQGTSLYVNRPDYGITTPALTATSSADGSFALRGLDFEERMTPGVAPHQERAAQGAAPLATPYTATAIPAVLWATGTFMGPPWMGATDVTLHPPGTPAGTEPLPVITLYPASMLRGQIVNPVSEQPVEDARVAVESWPAPRLPLPPASVSDADGRFELGPVPLVAPLYLLVSRSGLSRVEFLLRPEGATTSLRLVENLQVRLRPYDQAHIGLIEAATGKPSAEDVTLHCVAVERDAEGHVQTGSERAALEPGKTFDMEVTTGPNECWITPPLYAITSGAALPNGHTAMEVPATREHRQDLVLKVRKNPSFFVRMESDDTKWGKAPEFHVFTRAPGGQPVEWGETSYEWVETTARWGDKIELRVTRAGHDIVPWTTIVAAPDHWPIVFNVAASAVRGTP